MDLRAECPQMQAIYHFSTLVKKGKECTKLRGHMETSFNIVGTNPCSKSCRPGYVAANNGTIRKQMVVS